MILGLDKLLELVSKNNLVENLSPRELETPEGAGFDIRLGEIFEIKGSGYLGVEDRKTPKEKSLAKFDSKKNKSFVFKPGKYHLVKTIEKVNLTNNLTAHIFSRSTLFRSGISLLVTQVAPGYSGELVFGMVNLGKSNIKIDLGSRIAHIQFLEVKGGGRKYKGQWQGGRVSARNKEKQI